MLNATSSIPLERQASLYYGDGLFDIILGVGLLFGAIVIVFFPALFWLVAILPPLAVILMQALKQRITAPRLRSNDIPPDAERRIRQARIVTLSLLVVLALLGLLANFLFGASTLPVTINWPWVAGGIACILLALLGYLGWAGHAWRFGIYVVLALIALAGAFWLQLGLLAPLVALGMIIALWGFSVLVRFLRDHPRLRGGAA